MRGAAAAVQQAGLPQDEGPAAHAQHPGAAVHRPAQVGLGLQAGALSLAHALGDQALAEVYDELRRIAAREIG